MSRRPEPGRKERVPAPGAGEPEVMFGLPFSTMGPDRSVAALVGQIFAVGGGSKVVVTPNVHHVVRLSKDADLKKLYLQADYIFPDGQPLVWLSKMTGGVLRRRVTGADLLPRMCEEIEKRGGEVFILGGFPGDEEKITGRFGRRFPRLKVNVHCPPPGFDPGGGEGEDAVRAVQQHKPDAVFVCLGMPKQEIWSFAAKEKLGKTVFLCVGAALDYFTGAYARAPRPFRAVGLEWFWRTAKEPGRLAGRYARDGLSFLPIAAGEAFSRLRR